eukprot:4416172-Alexandrium_andersonii.AAC.1
MLRASLEGSPDTVLLALDMQNALGTVRRDLVEALREATPWLGGFSGTCMGATLSAHGLTMQAPHGALSAGLGCHRAAPVHPQHSHWSSRRMS